MKNHMNHFNSDVALSLDSAVAGYSPLERVLCAAYAQASGGKGKDRHAAGDDFLDQPIMTIGRLLKSADGEAYQAIKKLREGLMMHQRGNTDAAIRECLGAINYIAAVALLLAESEVLPEQVQTEETHAQKADQGPFGDKFETIPPQATPKPPGEMDCPSLSQIEYAILNFGYKGISNNRLSAMCMNALSAYLHVLNLHKGKGLGEVTFTSEQLSNFEMAKAAIKKWREFDLSASSINEKRKPPTLGSIPTVEEMAGGR